MQSEAIVPYMDRTSVARRIQLGAVRILQTKIAEASDGIMAKLQYRLKDDNSRQLAMKMRVEAG